MTIKPIVEWLHVTKSEKRKPTMNERVHEKVHKSKITLKNNGTFRKIDSP